MLPPLSVLDLSPILQGSDASGALRNTVDLAQHVERLGFKRFWLAEHHNMPGIASAATSVVIARVAAATSSIRVGAGGVMLPNHSPLVIAEQFGTLEAMFPGRIDLGLGRAPGTDMRTAHALRRDLATSSDRFPEDVNELISLFRDPIEGQAVRAIPGAGLHVPIWILGSSLFGAQLAAKMGLPYAFASHFAPDHLDEASEIYRRYFRPSASMKEPRLMVAANVFAADTDEEAARLSTSLQQAFVALRRGAPRPLPPPVDSMDGIWTPLEQAQLRHVFACTMMGSPARVEAGLEAFVQRTKPDELIITSQIFDHSARLRSFEIVADIAKRLSKLPRCLR